MNLPEAYADWGQLSFFVPGKPQPQGSKVRTRWAMREDNPNVGPWRERMAIMAHESMRDTGLPMLVDIPVVLAVEFVVYRPGSVRKSWTPPAIKKPDEDKLLRAVGDALTGIVWKDDSQVTTHLAHKRLAEIGEEMGARIWIAIDQTCYFGDESPSRDGLNARKATG